MKDNFFVKAWRGEEKFWKVFLVGVVGIGFLFILASAWNARMPMIMLSIGIILFLIPIKRCKKNMIIAQEKSVWSVFINLLIFLFFVICILLTLFSLFSFFLTGAACSVHNGEFCRNFF